MRTKCCYIFIVISFLIGCTSGKSNNSDNYADQIQVIYRKGPEIHSQIDSLGVVSVELINLSPKCIEFPVDFGIVIFANLGQSDVEVKNLGVYHGDHTVSLMANGDQDNKGYIGAMPDTRDLNLNSPTNFTMFIRGQLCDDHSVKVEKKIPFVVNP